MNVLKDLWEDKPLFITVVAALAGILYILYKSNHANVVVQPAAPVENPLASGGVAPGTFVEESYYNNTSTTVNNPAPVSVPTPVLPKIIKPAPARSLGAKGAGKGDTNFWVYTVPAGTTLTSLAEFARWGTDYVKLANYRNNLEILQAAGVNTSNPFAPVPAGLQISV